MWSLYLAFLASPRNGNALLARLRKGAAGWKPGSAAGGCLNPRADPRQCLGRTQGGEEHQPHAWVI